MRTSGRGRPGLVLALLAALLVSAGAGAQPTAPSPRAARLFDEGKELFEQKRWAEACARLEESDRLDPSVGTSGLLAACQESRGRLAAAMQLYLETAERAKRAGDERESYARARAAALEPRVPRLAVRPAEGSPPGMRVRRDGLELDGATLGVELPVDPGAHVIVATAPGRAPSRLSVELAAGTRRTVTIEAGAPLDAGGAASPPAPHATGHPDTQAREAPPTEASSGDARRTIGWVAGGVGVVAVGFAAVTGEIVIGKKGVMDDHCPKTDGNRRCDAEGAAAREDVRPLLTANGIAWGVGIAGLTVGAVLLLTAGKPTRTTTVAPTASRSGGGIALVGRF